MMVKVRDGSARSAGPAGKMRSPAIVNEDCICCRTTCCDGAVSGSTDVVMDFMHNKAKVFLGGRGRRSQRAHDIKPKMKEVDAFTLRWLTEHNLRRHDRRDVVEGGRAALLVM